MTTRRWFLVLLLLGASLPAQEEGGLIVEVEFTDADIRRHLADFDGSYQNREFPEADAVAALLNLRDAYLWLRAKGERLSAEQLKLRDDILDRVTKGLAVKRRPIVNIECAKALGEMGDPKGTAPLLAWLKGLLAEPSPNPQAVESGFLSLAWIGSADRETLRIVLDQATGKHESTDVVVAAIQACYEWRELDGETRKQFFDGICAFLEKLSRSKDDPTAWKRYKAVEKDGLQALRELGDGATRFESPTTARAWFAKSTKWEKDVGPRFRK